MVSGTGRTINVGEREDVHNRQRDDEFGEIDFLDLKTIFLEKRALAPGSIDHATKTNTASRFRFTSFATTDHHTHCREPTYAKGVLYIHGEHITPHTPRREDSKPN